MALDDPTSSVTPLHRTSRHWRVLQGQKDLTGLFSLPFLRWTASRILLLLQDTANVKIAINYVRHGRTHTRD